MSKPPPPSSPRAVGTSSAAAARQHGEEVPDAAIRWAVANGGGASSNAELAALSNVDRRWRRIVGSAILDMALDGNGSGGGGGGEEEKVDDGAAQQQRQRRKQNSSKLLLLPSMVRRLQESSRCESVSGNTWSTARETYCAAWFHPGGINEVRVRLLEGSGGNNGNPDDDYALGDDCSSFLSTGCNSAVSEPFAPSGGNGGGIVISLSACSNDGDGDADDADRRSVRSRRRRRQTSSQHSYHSAGGGGGRPYSSGPGGLSGAVCRSPAASLRSINLTDSCLHSRAGGSRCGKDNGKSDVTCCNEWRGYRHPAEVLQHFGYAPSFVGDLLQAAANPRRTAAAAAHHAGGSNEHGSGGGGGGYDLEENLRKMPPHQPTFAVRGACVARPESYCLCLDDTAAGGAGGNNSGGGGAATAGENLENRLREATNGRTSEWVDIRLQEYKQSVIRRNRRRRELQRDVLPRVLSSTCTRGSSSTASGEAEDEEEEESGAGPVVGRKQRSVQFLNSSCAHAVCMTTPFFGCGPISEPVTIFCVGIATEDGCFLSGLFHRYELGHLYPNSVTAETTEHSAICVATESWDEEDETAADSLRRNSLGSLPYNFTSDDSSFESSDEHGSSDIKCDCVFKGVNDKLDILYEQDERNARSHGDVRIPSKRISRGRFGPGSWHCYAAVVDGDKTEIRIDGAAEPTVIEQKGGDDGGTTLHRALLDGLTIGSDHCFGMSLCCGFGSGGEGEGAIAELAVFAGRLDPADIHLMEQQLMDRHGIPPVENEDRRDKLWNDYQLTREGQALYARNPQPNVDRVSGEDVQEEDHEEGREGIPLRYMARHRLVAWRQRNAVTGEEMRVSKIGCPPDATESSDWAE